MKIADKHILVTGAGSGIGRAMAMALAKEGAQLVLCGRNLEPLEETAALLKRASPLVVTADVTKAEDRRTLVSKVMQHGKGLDILINNAGVNPCNLLPELDDETLLRVFQTNVMAPFSLIRDFLPLLKVAAPAHIVNMGSLFGYLGFPYFSGYCASKFALRGMSDALRRELEPFNIGVTYVAPKATKTPAADNFDHLVDRFDMSFDDPSNVAGRVIKAIKQNRKTDFPGLPERLFPVIQGVAPRIIDAIVRKQMKEGA